MDVPVWAWVGTVVLIAVMLVADFAGHARKADPPSLKQAAWWSGGYVVVALLFGLFVLWQWGSTYAIEYYSGYITEKSLSADNLFVFVLIFHSFRVPRRYQQKVLLIGIVIALLLRTLFILAGAAAIAKASWVFYLFGAFLLYTAYTQVRKNDDGEYRENGLLQFARRVMRTTDDYVDDQLTARIDGRRYITPMMIVVFAIGSADVMFAVDSIPAIFGLTQEPFLVFAANAFSLLGLLQLYFLIDGLLDRIVYLQYGLAAILAFIGAKLVIHALHTNKVDFINNGQPWLAIPEPGTFVSLTVIIGILVVTTALSLTIGARRLPGDSPDDAGPNEHHSPEDSATG